MAKQKKKFNVGLFILLLLLGLLPGIIYLIVYLIPKVDENEEPKSNGWVVSLVGSIIGLASWIYSIVSTGLDEGFEDLPIVFYFALMISVVLLVIVVLNKKVASKPLIVLTILVAIVALAFNVFFTSIYGIIAEVGLIVTLVGAGKSKRYFKYHNRQNSQPAEVEEIE